MQPGQAITASVVVTNNSKVDGKEVVQLYIRDMVGSITRPVKELKGFKKIFLRKGESGEVQFSLTVDDLRFYNDKLEYIYEPGDFKVFIGGSSDNVKEASFTLLK